MNNEIMTIKTEPDTVHIKKEDLSSENPQDRPYTIYSNFFESANSIATMGIKTEPDVKLEKDEPLEGLHCSKSIHEHERPTIVKTEPEFTNVSESEVYNEYSGSDDSSGRFIEYCENVKKCNSPPNHDIDAAFFNRDYKEVYIKEDIDEVDVEEHDIKLEPDDYNVEPSRKQKKIAATPKKGENLKCHSCSYKTSNPSSLKKHLTLHEDPSTVVQYYCTQCNYRTRQKCHLKRHVLIHKNTSEIPMYTCYNCNFKTKQKCTLKRHITNVHINELSLKKGLENTETPNDSAINMEEYFCNKCPYKTYKKGLLSSHMDKHKDVDDVMNLYICDICSFSTKYRRNLRVHLETHQESEDLRIYKCRTCRFKTRIGYCLKRHLLSKRHLLEVGKIEEYCPRSQKT